MKKYLILFYIIFFTSLLAGQSNKTQMPISYGSKTSSNVIRPDSEVFSKSDYKRISTDYNQGSNIPISKVASGDWQTIMYDNFEGPFPGNWQVFAKSGFANAYWGTVSLVNNNTACWCAESGTQHGSYGNNYANNMEAWMIYGPFDLSDAQDAFLQFDYFNSCEPDSDYFSWFASTDGQNFKGNYSTGIDTSEQFSHKVINFNNFPGFGNLLGKDSVYIAFRFKSNSTNSQFWGAVIDNVSITKSTGITLSHDFTFGVPTVSANYRMIGIPGQSSIPITQFITGNNNADWKAFYDNGAQTNYLVAYDGSNQFDFGQGRAFWVLSKNSINISGQAKAVNLANGSTSDISLHSGWNIITDLFDTDVIWSSIQSLNGLPTNAVIYYWNGTSWAEPTTFSPYLGYYFNNIYGLSSLSIPYNIAGKIKAANKKLQNSNSKELTLALVSNGIEKSSITIGVNANSSAGLDNYDLYAPPGDFDEVRISVDENNLKTSYKKLFKDFIPSINNGKTFHLTVKNTTKKEVLLEVKGIKEFSGYNIYLFNKNLDSYYDLSANDILVINSSPPQQSFDLIITKSDSIKSFIKNSLPKEFALYNNYPNPFNPTTVIRYSVPVTPLLSFSQGGEMGDEQLVTLKVYDILGREVSTLVNKEQKPGNYEVQFDGSRLASGIYFYKLHVNGFSQTKKMILLK